MMEKDSDERRRGYEFGLMDQVAKKEIRRACLKAVSVPGYQVPFASREMPMTRGFGTGGLQITLSIIGPDDRLKVIDQGAENRSTPAISATSFAAFARAWRRPCGPARPRSCRRGIASRKLRWWRGRSSSTRFPCPTLLTVVENRESRRAMHAEADYSRLYVKLYEDLVHFQEITLSSRYPVHVHAHYIMDPSPIPRWDVPKLHQSPWLNLFGAGREKKIYAVPPYTDVRPLEFDDVAFRVEDFTAPDGSRRTCSRCGSATSYLDELYAVDGGTVFACSDTEYCDRRRESSSTEVQT